MNTGKSSDKDDEVEMYGYTIAEIFAEEVVIDDIEKSRKDLETNDSGRKKVWKSNVIFTV